MGVGVDVAVGVAVGVWVRVCVGLGVAVGVRVGVAVEVAVGVGVSVGGGVALGASPHRTSTSPMLAPLGSTESSSSPSGAPPTRPPSMMVRPSASGTGPTGWHTSSRRTRLPVGLSNHNAPPDGISKLIRSKLMPNALPTTVSGPVSAASPPCPLSSPRPARSS